MIASALAYALWLVLAWGVEVHWLKGITIGHYFFKAQDLTAMAMGSGALVLGGVALRLVPDGV